MQSITRWLFTDDKALSPWSIAAGAFLGIVAVAAVQWLIFRQLAKRSSARARSWRSSRERQVMEQHESLVQGMLGVVMQFHALAAKLPEDDAMRTSFSASLDAADRVLTASQDVDGLPGPYPQAGTLRRRWHLQPRASRMQCRRE